MSIGPMPSLLRRPREESLCLVPSVQGVCVCAEKRPALRKSWGGVLNGSVQKIMQRSTSAAIICHR